jgi:hypothetical protein
VTVLTMFTLRVLIGRMTLQESDNGVPVNPSFSPGRC